MKASLSLLVFLTIMLVGCQKEISHEGLAAPQTESTYYIKAKVDGVQENFATLPNAIITTLGGATTLIMGAATADTKTIGLTLNMTAGTPTPGTYTEGLLNPAYRLIGTYNDGSMALWTAAGLVPFSADPLRVTITSLTDTTVTGSFKGAFYKQDIASGGMPTTEFKRFTDGAFHLRVR